MWICVIYSDRHLAMVASDENLTAVRLRTAAASPVSKSQQSNKSSRNFQEDLMRLIDPDLSLTEGDLTQDRVSTTLTLIW